MLSTDLVPVHNDIWRKLPLFLKGFEPSLWRRQKGHKGCDLNTDPEVFLLSCIQFWVVDLRYFCTHCLHFTGLTLCFYIWACLEYWSTVKILEVWAGKLKQQQQRVYTQNQGFIYIFHHSPLIKLGNATTIYIYLPLNSTQWDRGLLLPKQDRNQSTETSFCGCYQTQQHLQDNGRGG